MAIAWRRQLGKGACYGGVVWPIVAHLLDLCVTPASRRDELASLRLRLLAEPGAHELPPALGELARQLEQARRDAMAAFGPVESCGRCARGHPLPHGRWSGGHCCGGGTDRVFSQNEIALLRAAGTRVTELRAPRTDHAGCIFRGPAGCSLAVEHRPVLCVRFRCVELDDELRELGRLGQVRAACRLLQQQFARFTAMHARIRGRCARRPTRAMLWP